MTPVKAYAFGTLAIGAALISTLPSVQSLATDNRISRYVSSFFSTNRQEVATHNTREEDIPMAELVSEQDNTAGEMGLGVYVTPLDDDYNPEFE
ncbi:MAG: hypothetical protein SP4CHLAM5_03460 [Chlamydiia bacterium]|nr:hypothetical protein [Chlamydiia bacterium]MCH9618220.1 hypothetical protein [Chlamydiia bacterium]MCH9624057.1 hypothetical protein [Chlamydiia bacterium]